MSSFVIGLDIGGSHVTAALIRLEPSLTSDLSVDHDTLYTRFCPSHLQVDPRAIVSTWIGCIDDLLRSFLENCLDNDTIIGIACGIPGPMDYERGLCYIRSSTFKKFDKCFGLNVSLSLQCGLRDLAARWKADAARRRTSPESNPAHRDKPIRPLPRMQVIRSKTSCLFNEFSIGTSLLEARAKTETIHFCGQHDLKETSRLNGSITQSNEGVAHFDNSELRSTTKSSCTTTADLTAKFASLLEQLPHQPISFYNDATCFALGEAKSVHHRDYERVLALTLGTGFGSAFIDRGEIISDRSDVPSGGMLWHCPYDANSSADDCFSTRGLIDIYHKLLQGASIDDPSGSLPINRNSARSSTFPREVTLVS